MKYLKNILAAIGFVVVLGSLIWGVQSNSKQATPKTNEGDIINDKNVGDGYNITAIAIPEDLNFAGEAVPLDRKSVV